MFYNKCKTPQGRLGLLLLGGEGIGVVLGVWAHSRWLGHSGSYLINETADTGRPRQLGGGNRDGLA